LKNFFSTHTNLGEKAIKSTVETFKALCSLAEFNGDYDDFDDSEDEVSEDSQKSQTHKINLSLGEGRRAQIILPEDINENDIKKVKGLLDALM